MIALFLGEVNLTKIRELHQSPVNLNNYETEADYICDDQNNGLEETINTDAIMDYQEDVLDTDDKLEAKLEK